MLINILLVHAAPLSNLGGAEISLAEHVRGAPRNVNVDVVQPDDDRDLAPYDAIIIANTRPPGGVGEAAEAAPALHWAARLRHYSGFSLKSERDIHPCTHRDARCFGGRQLRYVGCDCSRLMRDAFEELYDACTAVQFLSPGHKRVINELTRIRRPQYVIAPPIDLSNYKITIPRRHRPQSALILGDPQRVAPTAEERARSAGYEPHRVPYLSVPHGDMPKLYNRHQAVVVDPVMYHAFGRIAVEAMACGCKVIASERVGAMSWWNPRGACSKANQRFWQLIVGGCRNGSPADRTAP